MAFKMAGGILSQDKVSNFPKEIKSWIPASIICVGSLFYGNRMLFFILHRFCIIPGVFLLRSILMIQFIYLMSDQAKSLQACFTNSKTSCLRRFLDLHRSSIVDDIFQKIINPIRHYWTRKVVTLMKRG